LGSALASGQTKTLVRAEQVEVIRLVVPAGKEIEEHKAKGEIIVQCLEGRVAFTAFGKTHNLEGVRADHQADRAVRVHVIGAVLCIVLNDEYRHSGPIFAVGDALRSLTATHCAGPGS
jgi:hypothetical protein